MARKRQNDDGRREQTPNKPDDAGKPKNTVMIALIAGGALLLCCSCGGVGAGGWFFRAKLGLGTPVAKSGDDKKDPAADTGAKDGKAGEKPPRTETRKPDFVSTGEALHREYTADPKAADAKYKGKIVEITWNAVVVLGPNLFHVGAIDEKKSKFKGKLPVGSITCTTLPDYAGVVGYLSFNQKVKVIGVVTRGDVFQVHLKDCSVAELEKSTILIMTVEEIGQDCDKNPAGARERYAAMDIVISGKIDAIQKAPDGSGLVKLLSSSKTRLHVIGNDAQVRDLSPGQTIEFRTNFLITGFTKTGAIQMPMTSLVKVRSP